MNFFWELRRGKKGKAAVPSFWLQYLEKCTEAASHRKLPIEQGDFVVLDTETTGLLLKKDRILSIGAIRVRNSEMDLSQSYECFINQGVPVKQDTIAVHGILPGTKSTNIEEQEAIEQFVNFLGGAVIVGHHIAFDIEMINHALKRMGLPKLRNKSLDTGTLAQRLEWKTSLQPADEYSLDKICKKFDIRLHDRHTAMGDAYITAILFQKLIWRLQQRGVKTMRDLLKRRR
ncbi:MAG: 3'-5' exonuclease [Bacteroidota bacterium]